jgi:hypothetical protein
MTRVQELQEIECLTAAYLTEDDPVWAVAEGCFQEVPVLPPFPPFPNVRSHNPRSITSGTCPRGPGAFTKGCGVCKDSAVLRNYQQSGNVA